MSKYSVGTVTRRPSCTKLVSGAYTKQTYNIFGAESNNTKVLGESNKDNVAPISQNAEESAPIKQSTRVAPGGKSSEDNILAHPSASPNNTRKTPKKYSSQTLPRGWAQSSNIFDSNAPEVAQKRSSIRVTNSRPRGNDIFNSVTDENVPAPSHTSVHVSPTLGAGKSSNIFSTEGAAPVRSGRKVMMAPPGQAKEAFDHETPLPPHVVKADPMRVSHVFGAAEEDNNTPRSSTKRMFAPGGPSNVFSDAPVEQKRSIATARINESSNIFAAAGSPPKPKYDSNKKNVSHNILAGPAEEDNLTPRSRYESNKKNVSANVLNLGGDVPSAAEPTKHSVHNRMMESSIFSGKMESDNAPQRSSTRVLGGAGGGKSNIFDA